MLKQIIVQTRTFFNASHFQFARHHKQVILKQDYLKLTKTDNDQKQPQPITPQKIVERPMIQQPVEVIKKDDNESGAMRLSKYLSQCGICSRRQAEKFIEQGLVYVNKKQVLSNISVDQTHDIQVFTKQGQKIPIKQDSKIWLFYKPMGLICSHSDPFKRPTVYDFVKEQLNTKMHIISVGRLDFNSEGLLILTNDGQIARMMELPSSKIEREYRVRVFGILDQVKLKKIQEGVTISNVKYGPFFCQIENRQTRNTWLRIKMSEGKNREIRKVMRKFSLRVNRIIRVRYGPYTLSDLKPGQIIETIIDNSIKKKLYQTIRQDLKTINKQRQNLLEETDIKIQNKQLT